MNNLGGKCLILGGGGFIGAAVIERLIANGVSLRIFDRNGVKPNRIFHDFESVEWVTGNFTNKAELVNNLRDVDTVIHLISSTLPKSSNEAPIDDVEMNVIGTLRLLDAMREAGVKRIIYASSGGTIYGLPIEIPIRETHPTQPEVSYGITKLMTEKYLFLYSHLHGIEHSILRIANPYGVGQRIETAQGAVAAFLHKAINKTPIEIWGDGSVVRDYLHVDDVADAFAKALIYRGNERVFNIGSGAGTSLNELVSLIEEAVGYPVEKRHLASRKFDVPINILDNSLAQTELNWSPKITLLQGIRMTLNKLIH